MEIKDSLLQILTFSFKGREKNNNFCEFKSTEKASLTFPKKKRVPDVQGWLDYMVVFGV